MTEQIKDIESALKKVKFQRENYGFMDITVDENWEEHNKEENIKTILKFYSQIDGSHHKAWCLDQIARIVYGKEYQDFIHHYEYIDDDGVEHDEPIYKWDYGIAP